jgi:hypothetical protein
VGFIFQGDGGRLYYRLFSLHGIAIVVESTHGRLTKGVLETERNAEISGVRLGAFFATIVMS